MMRIKSSSSVGFAVWLVSALLHQVGGQTECIANPSIAADFNDTEGSCCMVDVCGIPCPEPVTPPAVGESKRVLVCEFWVSCKNSLAEFRQYLAFSHSVCHALKIFDSIGFGIVIGVGIIISFVVGVATLFLVHGEAENFFIAGRSLPLWIVSMTLGAQSIDSNSILGNADLSYKYHFYDGVVLPIGLGLSLILNGLLLARHINAERNVLTLPDVFSKRYGRVVEVLVSIAAIVSFMMLLAGNFVGMGVVLAYVWGFSLEAAIWTTFVIVWAYTVSGGLFSVAYTDVVQGIMGWSGCAVFVYWMIANQDPKAPPPSIGFPGYVYPDLQGDGGICDMYQGIPCTNNATLCCYNADVWCTSDDNCTTDNGAYPIGDQPIFSNQMTDYLALAVSDLCF
jgi:Sodium:solute symporter family